MTQDQDSCPACGALPCDWVNNPHGATAAADMTLRDYFAGQVVPAMIERYLIDNGTGIGADHFYLNVPVRAYRFADAMLAARSQPLPGSRP